MSGNLGCIGFGADDCDTAKEQIFSTFEGARPEYEVHGRPTQSLRWTDSSGASVVFHLNGHAIRCVTPFFEPGSAAPSRWRVRTSAPRPDPECRHCSGADCDVLDSAGELVTRAAVQWLYFDACERWLAEPKEFDLQLVAFAHRAAFFGTEGQFVDGQREWWSTPGEPEPGGEEGKPLRLAPNAFLPEGMFGPAEETLASRAMALFAGSIRSCERRMNAHTGRAFWYLRVASLPGELDVVIDDGAFEGTPAPGGLALVRAWLVGKPDPMPGPGPRPWWRRLLG